MSSLVLARTPAVPVGRDCPGVGRWSSWNHSWTRAELSPPTTFPHRCRLRNDRFAEKNHRPWRSEQDSPGHSSITGTDGPRWILHSGLLCGSMFVCFTTFAPSNGSFVCKRAVKITIYLIYEVFSTTGALAATPPTHLTPVIEGYSVDNTHCIPITHTFIICILYVFILYYFHLNLNNKRVTWVDFFPKMTKWHNFVEVVAPVRASFTFKKKKKRLFTAI